MLHASLAVGVAQIRAQEILRGVLDDAVPQEVQQSVAQHAQEQDSSLAKPASLVRLTKSISAPLQDSKPPQKDVFRNQDSRQPELKLSVRDLRGHFEAKCANTSNRPVATIAANRTTTNRTRSSFLNSTIHNGSNGQSNGNSRPVINSNGADPNLNKINRTTAESESRPLRRTSSSAEDSNGRYQGRSAVTATVNRVIHAPNLNNNTNNHSSSSYNKNGTSVSTKTSSTASSIVTSITSLGSSLASKLSMSEERVSERVRARMKDNSANQEIPSIVDQLPDEVDPPAEARRTTSKWDPTRLVDTLYVVPEPLRDKPRPKERVNIEGFLERLPSGRKKATFWNAWKRCYFRARDGFLYCYATAHSDKPLSVTQLMGGQLDNFESIIITAQDRNPTMVPMIGIDDRMGHYLVVRASCAQDTERWTLALRTHTVEDFCSTYVQPWPVPRAPALLRDSIVIDLGSCSVRAGVLCTQPSLPQLFFPALCATRRGSGDRVFGTEALLPRIRATSTLSYPIRPSHSVKKHSVDLAAVSGLVGVALRGLAVDPRDYGVVLSVPRALDPATQTRLVGDLFDRYGVRSVVLSHQSVLALYAYNATSGIVVDIGERTDIVPIMDGYIVEGGVSRVPYGGVEVTGHVRRLLLQRSPPGGSGGLNTSLGTVAEGLLPRLALERLCFVSADYRADMRRAENEAGDLTATVSVREYFDKDAALECLTLETGRFQAPEGLFHPSAWGVDSPGVHKMVHKAIQECSMDARKTMARSVFLAGGLTMLPGLPDRLSKELASLLPPSVVPKVHASPYRYHAAYIGACVLANSDGVDEMLLSREEWARDGGRLIRPWIL